MNPKRHKCLKGLCVFSKIYLWLTAVGITLWISLGMWLAIGHNPGGEYCDYTEGGAGYHIIKEDEPCRILWHWVYEHLLVGLIVAAIIQTPFWILLYWSKYKLAKSEGKPLLSLSRYRLVSDAYALSKIYLILTSIPIILWGGFEAIVRIFETGQGQFCDFTKTTEWYYITFGESCYGFWRSMLEIGFIFGILIVLIQSPIWLLFLYLKLRTGNSEKL